MIRLLIESDEQELELRKRIGDPHDFDMQLAEYRARELEKDLGLDIERKGKDVYHSGGSYIVEMNLHNAGAPLNNLIDKVEKTLLAPPEE